MGEGSVKLHRLVDLALCEPEVGAVNFNALRTLLHSMLTMCNLGDASVDYLGPPGNPFDNKLGVESNSNNNNNNNNNNDNDGKNIRQEAKVVEKRGKTIATILRDQEMFESRLGNLEKLLITGGEFPPNEDIMKSYQIEETAVGDGETDKEENGDLCTIWKNKVNVRRLHGAETAIEKLFSLMNDVLLNDKSKSLEDGYEQVLNQLSNLQNQFNDTKKAANNLDKDMNTNKNMLEDWSQRLQQLDENLKKSSSELSSKIDENSAKLEAMQVKTSRVQGEDRNRSAGLESHLENLQTNMDEFMKLLDEKVDNKQLQVEVDQLLERERNDTALFDNIIDGIQRSLTGLSVKVDDIQEAMAKLEELNTNTQTGLSRESEAIRQLLDQHISKTDEENSAIKSEIERLKQNDNNQQYEDRFNEANKQYEERFNNINQHFEDRFSDINKQLKDRFNEIMELISKLSSSSKGDDEMNALMDTVRSLSRQLEEKEREATPPKEEKIEEPVIRQPTIEFDTTVVAAIQHLAQENRQHITSMQESMKMLQKFQMTSPPKKLREDPPATKTVDKNPNADLLEVLEKHVVILEEEQAKQAGHVANMVEDYAKEFNRKQLHIDALYEYIEKLQKGKADKEDMVLEMNIKADKKSLDSKVSMSTFDERYQMLEQMLQQALDRLDMYAAQESSLKLELEKLNEDLSSKMDTEAGRQLKKFLNDRLKSIQEARSHLSDAGDERIGTAAGLRHPMSLKFSCLSCDRSLDVSSRGVIPSVPYPLPARNPLTAPAKPEKEGKLAKRVENQNRFCGGTHTSVNINMLRLMKFNPNTMDLSKSTALSDEEIVDCVIGTDGQSYRGRYKNQEAVPIKNNRQGSGKVRRRLIHSASAQLRSFDEPTGGPTRPHTAASIDNKIEETNTFHLPSLLDSEGGQPIVGQ